METRPNTARIDFLGKNNVTVLSLHRQLVTNRKTREEPLYLYLYL